MRTESAYQLSCLYYSTFPGVCNPNLQKFFCWPNRLPLPGEGPWLSLWESCRRRRLSGLCSHVQRLLSPSSLRSATSPKGRGRKLCSKSERQRRLVTFHAHSSSLLHILIRIAKRRLRMKLYEPAGSTERGDLDDLIFCDTDYEVSRR